MWSTWRDEAYTLEEQLAQLRQQVAAAEAELVEREAKLADLHVELAAFQRQYDARGGRQFEELAAVEEAIGRCKVRIDAYREWGPAGPPRMRDGTEYVPVEEQYRRTWREPAPPGPSFPPPPLDVASEREIRQLYRRLCRRFHPDLTQDPVERAWRTEMMAAVNAAYAAQSLAELRALAAQPDRPVAPEGGADRRRMDGLRERLHHIRRRIRAAEREAHDLMNGPMMELSLEIKYAARQGRDLLAEMAQDAAQELARKRAELDFLRSQLRRLGLECE